MVSSMDPLCKSPTSVGAMLTSDDSVDETAAPDVVCAMAIRLTA